MDALFSGKFQSAADLADPLNDDVVKFSDTAGNRTYYILVECTNTRKQPLRGLGTYIYNPTACRNLSFQAPHAVGDENAGGSRDTLCGSECDGAPGSG